MAVEELVSVIAKMLTMMGLPRSCARVLAVLYAVGVPLSVKELIDLTGYSRSSVFYAVKVLESDNLLLRMRKGRIVVYKPAVSLARLLVETQARLLERARRVISKLVESGHGHENIVRLERELRELAAKLFELGGVIHC